MSKDQVDQVSSWVHNEGKCMSIGGVSQSLGVSRSQAQALLGKIPSEEHSYRVTKCVVSTEEEENGEEEPIKSTVFKLVTEDFDPSKDMKDEETIEKTLYALSLADASSESLLTAHERDMAHLRDLLRDNNLDTIVSSDQAIANCTDLIAPAPAILEQIEKSRQEQQEELDLMEQDEKPVSTVPKSFSKGPRKATPASAFFSKVASKKTSGSNKSASTKEDEKENISSKRTTAAVQKKNESKKIGNADDFVGDVEDDDDDDEDDAMDVEPAPTKKPPPSKKPAANKKPRARKREPKAPKEEPMEEDDETENAELPVSGAMDAFATVAAKKPADGTKHKRRRKRLVEKTTMDKNGYLHTETHEVWEDIPSDEEEQEVSIISQKIPQRPAPAKKTKTSSSGKTTMKQGNIMGFFTKKK